jgi:hypothetical protein
VGTISESQRDAVSAGVAAVVTSSHQRLTFVTRSRSRCTTGSGKMTNGSNWWLRRRSLFSDSRRRGRRRGTSFDRGVYDQNPEIGLMMYDHPMFDRLVEVRSDV